MLEPDTGPDFYDNCDYGDVSYNGRSHGSTSLQDETSKSLTYGFVYAPTPNFDINADYYRIKINNEVEYQDSDTVLREEADCRLGSTLDGTPVDGNSAFCRQVESQVVRNPPDALYNPNAITSVLVLPINAAIDQTSGVDFNAHYRLNTTRAGSLRLQSGCHLRDQAHHATERQLAGRQRDDRHLLLPDPADQGQCSVTWNYHDFTATLFGSRLGGIPNYDGTQRLGPTFLYNLTMGYRVAPTANVSLVVDNLFDARPPHDSTWTSYPYYSRNWFSPVGRAYFVDLSVKLGGKHGG